MHVAARKVRECAMREYSAAVGAAGGEEILQDRSYRDKAGVRMADERFQKCLMMWYFTIRRLDTKYVVNDLSKLEFCQAELAFVDLEVGVLRWAGSWRIVSCWNV